MANLRFPRRAPFRPPHRSSVVPLPREHAAARWPWLAAAAVAALMAIAWANGGETSLRPIAQPVDLPERLQ